MYDYYRGSSSYEDAVKRQLTGIEATNVASTRALHEMNSNLRSAFQETNNIMKAGFGATLAMGAEIGNTMVAGFDATNNAIQNMAFGVTSAIRESTYDIVASQERLRQTFVHGFTAVNTTLNLGFSMVTSELNEIHDTLKNPLFTANRELYRRAYGNYKKGLYEEALEDFTGVVERDKTNWLAWYYIGCIYLFGASKFCYVIDVDKAEEAFFNAAKYIDYGLGKSNKKDIYGSEIYYRLGRTKHIKSNDLLIESKVAESRKKMEEAEYASRKSYQLYDKNLLALYEQAKALHFLDRDDEALQLIEKLIRTDKNYAVIACNDKNFESLWNKIESLITALRDELANKLAEEFSAIRVLGRKGNGLLADIQFPDEKQVSEFEQFYNSELIPSEFKTDEDLIRNICDDFDSLARSLFGQNNDYSWIYKSVIDSDAVIKNVHSERISWKNEFDKLESNIEQEIGHLETALKKENDYFSVRDKYSTFCGNNDNSTDFTPQRDKMASRINQMLEAFDRKSQELKNDIKVFQVYIDTQKVWPENIEQFQKKRVDELARECNAVRTVWKKRVEELRQQLAAIDFPTSKQIQNFEYFLHTTLEKDDNFKRNLFQHNGTFISKKLVYKHRNSVRSGRLLMERELDNALSLIERTLVPFETLQDKDYFFVVRKSKEFKESNLREPSSNIEKTFSELDEKLKELESGAEFVKSYVGVMEDSRSTARVIYISACVLSVICFAIQYMLLDNHPFWSGLIFLVAVFFALFSGIFGGILWIGGAVLLFVQGHPVLGVISSLAAIGAFYFHKVFYKP